MTLAILCPLHRRSDLPTLEATLKRLQPAPGLVLLLLNGAAKRAHVGFDVTDVLRADCRDVSEARNLLLEACAAEAFAFVDADDYYSPDWLARAQRRLAGVDACGLGPGWTHIQGELWRFVRPSDCLLGGTIAGLTRRAVPFVGALAEDSRWTHDMRAAGRSVRVDSDPSGYCYRPSPHGTAQMSRARLLAARGPALSYGARSPLAIDDGALPHGEPVPPPVPTDLLET